MKFRNVLITFFFGTALAASVEKIKNYKANYNAISPMPEDDILKQGKNYWWRHGTEHLRRLINSKPNDNPVAKNVIIFIGDGMGITTTTAARIYKGQRHFYKGGEAYSLNFEKFPNVALVKTYNVDKQVPDSAGTATALFTGVKTRYNAIGVDVESSITEWDREIFQGSKLDSFMTWAQQAGKSTGIVTTTRITHATPAGTYARINHRDWECDSKIPLSYRNKAKDIARQLIEDEPGKHFKVILGGGLQQMGYVYNVKKDKCSRTDNLNLTQIWMNNHRENSIFATNNGQLNKVDENVEYLLGLFDVNHLPFELVRNKNETGTPSLTEMTQKALTVLKKNPAGFVLMVEGGLIDQAHHKNFARLAMEETSEFDNAIKLVLKETGPDTLILVTADHSHSFTLNGYAKRGNDILGFGNKTSKIAPYLTLSYANGPGFGYHYMGQGSETLWRDVWNDETRLKDPWYQHPGMFYLEDDSHGGEDVAIYATGPNSHLIKGVMEQNVIAHFISYAACIGPHSNLNEHCLKSASSFIHHSHFAMALIILIIKIR